MFVLAANFAGSHALKNWIISVWQMPHIPMFNLQQTTQGTVKMKTEDLSATKEIIWAFDLGKRRPQSESLA